MNIVSFFLSKYLLLLMPYSNLSEFPIFLFIKLIAISYILSFKVFNKNGILSVSTELFKKDSSTGLSQLIKYKLND